MFFCCGVHDSIKKHGIKECAVEYRKMFYGPVMNKVTENRENQGTESNVLQQTILGYVSANRENCQNR